MDISSGKLRDSLSAAMSGSGEAASRITDDMFVGWNPPEEPNEKKGAKGIPRLAHKKSKTGCQRCRARRVKCDEAKPICGGCNRHQVTCFYDHSVRTTDKPTTDSETSSTPAYSRALPTDRTSNEESTARRLLELKLMHQWTLSTCLTFPLSSDASVRDINTTIMPNLGLTNEALLYCLFFISALHLIKTEKYSVEAAQAYQNYLDLTIRAHRVDVTNLTSSNADVVCMTSSLLRFGSFAILADRSLSADKTYTAPTQWMNMNQGATAVHRATWPWIVNNPVSIANRAVIQKTPNLTDFETLFHPSNRQHLLHLLTNPPGYEESWSPEIQKAYEQTLSFIGAMQLAIDGGIEGHGEILRRCVAFPGLIPKRFFDLVEEGRPRALVIMAYYFAYLARFKDIWWIGNAGAREARAIGEAMGAEWVEMLRWPLRTVEELYL